MTGKRTDRSAQNVSNLRERFKQLYLSEKDLFYEEDYEKLMSDDWYVKRFFLARNRNEDEAYKMIVDTMKWRKSIKIREIKDYTFPREFYQIGGLFIYEPDKNGYLTVYIRVKMHRKIPELEQVSRQFLIHVLNKADILTQGNGIAVVFDVSSAGYRNLDMDYLKFLISSGTNYFPVGVKYILVLNVPWAFNAFRRMALSFLPEQWFGLLRFASGNEVHRFISPENLPDYLGGSCMRNYRACPIDSPSVSEVVAQYGYSQADIDRILPEFKDALEESDKALRFNTYIDPDENFFDRKANDISTEVSTSNSSEKVSNKNLNLIPNPLISYDVYGEVYLASLLVYNPNSCPIAFKIQSTIHSYHSVSPSNGIILPKSMMVVKIKLLPNQISISTKRHKFRVIGLPITESQMEKESFNQLWVDRKEEVIDHRFAITGDGKNFGLTLGNIGDVHNMIKSNHARSDSRGVLVNRVCDVTKKLDHLTAQHNRLWFIVFFLLMICLSMISYSFVTNFTKDPFNCFNDSPMAMYSESHQ